MDRVIQMDLSAVISNFYSRAGYVFLNNGATGSITFIGTVSPAGGNLKEPVTESTRKAARCFYGLSQARADSKRYPAIDPIDSYSKYLEYEEVQENLRQNLGEEWLGEVLKAKDVLLRGKEAMEQINILGDDGVPMSFHDRFWKSELIDFVILQQDAFDKIDCSTPMDRQKYMLSSVLNVADAEFKFKGFEEISGFFKEVINFYKQMNYSEFDSDQFKALEKSLEAFLKTRSN
jgi:V/A-type H+-transporting ATPase subunit A